jgi:hypothetical protein
VLSMEIPSARIPDFGTFNAYLPPGTPVKLLSGEASLTGDLKLGPHGAKGELLVKATDMRVGWDKEELSGDLRMDLLVQDGTPEDKRFDVSGSSLVLDDFKVVGEIASHERADWYARFRIQAAELLWQEPLQLEMKAGVTVKDSRPFIAIFDNIRGEHDWLAELATVEDLAGHLELTLDGKRAVLRDAMLGSDQINVGAKGFADAAGREAMVYARYGNLTGVVEVQGDKRQFDLIGARSRFDAYVPGKIALPPQDPAAGDQSASAALAKDRTETSLSAERPKTRIRERAVPSAKTGAKPAETKKSVSAWRSVTILLPLFYIKKDAEQRFLVDRHRRRRKR